MHLGKLHIPFTSRTSEDLSSSSPASRRRTRSVSQPPPSRSTRSRSDTTERPNHHRSRRTVKGGGASQQAGRSATVQELGDTFGSDRSNNLPKEDSDRMDAEEDCWGPSGEFFSSDSSTRQWGWLDEPYRPLPLDSPSMMEVGDHDVPPLALATGNSRPTPSLFRSFTSRNRSLRQLYQQDDDENIFFNNKSAVSLHRAPPLPTRTSSNSSFATSLSHLKSTSRRRSVSFSSPETTPPSPITRRISTSIDLEGHRVLSSRRRRSSIDQSIPLPPSPVRRLKTFGVGDDNEEDSSSDLDFPYIGSNGNLTGLYSCSFEASSQSCTSSPSVPPSDIFSVLSPQAMESDSGGGSIFSYSNHGHSSTTCFPLSTSPYSCNSATTRSLPAALGATPTSHEPFSTNSGGGAPRFLRRKSTTAIAREKISPPVLGIVARRGSVGQAWKVGTGIPLDILKAEAKAEAFPLVNPASLIRDDVRPLGNLQLTNPDSPNRPRPLRRLSSSTSMNGQPRGAVMKEAFVGWAL